MARIMYGLQGDAAGHINRARIVADEMVHHEFLFVGGGRARQLGLAGHAVEVVPSLETLYRDNKVDLMRTAANGSKVLFERRPVVERLTRIVRDFDPHLIISDYEYFTPLAARKLGRFCLSLDHQHILTHCLYDRPNQQLLGRLMGNAALRRLFSNTHHFLIISFFSLPPVHPGNTEVLPPVIKRSITVRKPFEDDHVVVYQTSTTFDRLLPVLEMLKRRFLIYGFGNRPPQRNLVFKEYSEETFPEDLASCSYVIVNGGHNVISEALYLGKPVFAFPIANNYEQFTNAYFIAKLGYGSYSTDTAPSRRVLEAFESRLDEYRGRIRSGDFFGNAKLVQRLEELIAGGRSPW